MITADQVRAARALLGISQTELHKISEVSLTSIQDFEANRRKTTRVNINAIKSALEKSGIQFIDENGAGAGVRFSKNSASR